MPGFSEKRRAAVDAAMKDEVYRTSVKILTEEGLSALTLDRIAKEVGVSRPTLYNYFPDRNGIISFIEDRVYEPLVDALDQIVDGEMSAREKLLRICSRVIDYIYEERALVLAMFHKELLEGAVRESKAERRDRALALFSRVVEEGVRSGEIRDVQPAVAAEVMLGAISGFVDGMFYSGNFATADKIVPGMLDILLRGLAAPEA